MSFCSVKAFHIFSLAVFEENVEVSSAASASLALCENFDIF